MIPKEISTKVLTLGPNYKTEAGGIASVISSYSEFFEPFHFISTTESGGAIKKILIFFKAVIAVPFTVLLYKIRIVHIHGASHTSFYRKAFFVYLCKLLRTKVLLHIHGGNFIGFYNHSRSKRILRTLQKGDAIIVLGKPWESFIKGILGHENIYILNNIIDHPILEEDMDKKKKDVLNLLFLGHITHKKGIFDLVEVFQENRRFFEGRVMLHIGGGLYEEKKLIQYLEDHELQDIVKFHGWVAGTEKAQLLSQTDVFILPSYTEGLPISILEAMSYSLPVITTSVGAIPDIIKEQENGLLVQPGNKKEIKESIEHFIFNRKKINLFGRNNRKKAEGFFPEVVEKELMQIYMTILNDQNINIKSRQRS